LHERLRCGRSSPLRMQASRAPARPCAGLLCVVLAACCGGRAAGGHERYRRELSSAFAWGGALPQSQSSLESPSCAARIVSPPAGTVWTASYLIVQWRLCPMDEMTAAVVIVRVDGQEMMRGPPSASRFTIHGIADGWHTVDLVATDDQGATLDLGPRMNLRFQVQRGESLLGSMARRVEAGEFGHIDAGTTDRADGPASRPHDREVPCAYDQNFTLVTAAINIGRRHGNISFEDDYIGNLRHILSLRCPVVIHLQEQYVHMLEPFLHDRAMIRYCPPRRTIALLRDRTCTPWVSASRPQRCARREDRARTLWRACSRKSERGLSQGDLRCCAIPRALSLFPIALSLALALSLSLLLSLSRSCSLSLALALSLSLLLSLSRSCSLALALSLYVCTCVSTGSKTWQILRHANHIQITFESHSNHRVKEIADLEAFKYAAGIHSQKYPL